MRALIEKITRFSASRRAVFGLLLLAVTGCDDGQNVYQPPPPPPVTVAQPAQKPITDYVEFSGNTQATETVDLRARVEGFLEKVNFQDGSFVKAGQVLFEIDRKPFEANLKEALATVESEQARLRRAEAEYARNLRLFKQNAAAETEVVRWEVERDGARAATAAAKARVDLALLDVSYATVVAPFDGRIGRRLVDAGNLVGATEKTLLATIERQDPIYAYFTINERDLLRLREKHREGRGPNYRRAKVPVYLGLQTEDGFPHEGEIDFADTNVDPETGTLLLRAILPNRNGVLLPGLFVRLRVPFDTRASAILIPERALGVDQQGQYVFVVRDDSTVERRSVTLGAQVDGLRVVEKGLNGDEWIIVNGVQRARDGVKVTPERQTANELSWPSASPAS
jgi:RND family efflux transporter MFP subunit